MIVMRAQRHGSKQETLRDVELNLLSQMLESGDKEELISAVLQKQ